MLTREQILEVDDRAVTETVSVPEWGGEVIVGVISGDERDRFDLYREKVGHRDGIRSLLVAMACRDENGDALFKPSDVNALGKKSSRALDRVFDVALRVNGLGEAAVEATAKN